MFAKKDEQLGQNHKDFKNKRNVVCEDVTMHCV